MAATLSDLLEAIRLRGTNWLVFEMGGSGAVRSPASNEAVLYLVLHGEVTLESAGEAPLALSAGSAAILLHGHAHTVRVAPGGPVELLQWGGETGKRDIPPVVYVGDGRRRAAARLIVGRLKVDAGPGNPILSMTPGVLSLAVEPAYVAFNPMMIAEFAARPGASAYLTRLGEVLLVRALVNYTHESVAANEAVESSLGASRILRAINSIAENPAAPWSVARLAREACMSRSTFAAEFTRVVGKSPMRVVAEHRLEAAAQVLARGSATVATAAHSVGYRSEATFARVFKRRFGVSPGAYHRQMRTAGKAERSQPRQA